MKRLIKSTLWMLVLLLACRLGVAHAQHGEHDPHTPGDGHSAAEHFEEGDHGSAEHEPSGSTIPELPNLVGQVHKIFHGTETGEKMDSFAEGLGLSDPNGTPFTALETLLYAGFVILVLSLAVLFVRRQLRVSPKTGRLSRPAMLAEVIVLYFEDFFGAIVGRDTVRKHLPFLGTLFIYIFLCNSLGLIFLGKAPTANLSFNLGMALLVFLYVHVGAIIKSPVGYLKHYPGTLPSIKEMGGMGYFLIPFMAFLFVVIHIMEAAIQPVSLSLRLFGNILGKDVLLGVFGSLVPWVPLHTPFLFLGLLLGAIQALIFSLLTAVYITLWLPHDDHHGDEAHHGHGEPAAGHA